VSQLINRSLFIFRRDLRLEDNTGLIFALKNSKEVIPCFIFTPTQIIKNPYRSNHSLAFLISSLKDLEKKLINKKAKLYLFWGEPEGIILDCIQKLKVDSVIVNRDYTPYSINRDKKIELLCKKQKIKFYSFDDALLNPPERTLKANGKPYTIFTPFFKNALQFEIKKPKINNFSNYFSKTINFAKNSTIYKKILPKHLNMANGGRSNAISILKNLKEFTHYEKERDYPALNKTTKLSSHLKFTTCSPREVYYAICKQLNSHSELIRSLYWRDFFTTIAFFYPEIFKGAFYKKFNKLKWNDNKSNFKLWCDGKTGVPIVDAGMREMNKTGFMHNRCRMITASFLVKDLHINWQLGEKYFAQTLIDYDPAINNGNWQWAASTGCDSQPYFRIFNPWLQAKKFDPKCLYIRKWIPELNELSNQEIHSWYLVKNQQKCQKYPIPMVDHSLEAKKTFIIYRKASLS
jgi:deoxyribodipyrimidine photo-lyase